MRSLKSFGADRFRINLQRNGYVNVETVYEHGEFALRGSLIDLFPMGSALPYRLDLFDADIESIKTFDVDTQRPLYPGPHVRLLPVLTADRVGLAVHLNRDLGHQAASSPRAALI